MKKEIKIKKTVALEEMHSWVTKTLECLNQGIIVVETTEGAVVLKPTGPVTMEVAAEIKKDREKIGFKFSWKSEAATLAERDASLNISGELPAEPAVNIPPEAEVMPEEQKKAASKAKKSGKA